MKLARVGPGNNVLHGHNLRAWVYPSRCKSPTPRLRLISTRHCRRTSCSMSSKSTITQTKPHQPARCSAYAFHSPLSWDLYDLFLLFLFSHIVLGGEIYRPDFRESPAIPRSSAGSFAIPKWVNNQPSAANKLSATANRVVPLMRPRAS